MKLLSTTSILPLETTQSDVVPATRSIIHRCIASKQYIVTSFSGTSTVHVFCSITGKALQKKPCQASQTVSGLVLDNDRLILTGAQSPELIIYDIPSEYVPFPV